jgi:hypothetical protein
MAGPYRGYKKVAKAAVAGAKKAKTGWNRFKGGLKVVKSGNAKQMWRNAKRNIKGPEYHGVPGGRTKKKVTHHMKTVDPSKVGGRR